MATKNISITEQAYNLLASKRKRNESFSEIIVEIVGNVRLQDFHGAISIKSADRLEETIEKLKEGDKKLEAKKLKSLYNR